MSFVFDGERGEVVPEIVSSPVWLERMTADTLDERFARLPDVVRRVVAIEDVDSRLVESCAEDTETMQPEDGRFGSIV